MLVACVMAIYRKLRGPTLNVPNQRHQPPNCSNLLPKRKKQATIKRAAAMLAAVGC